MARIRSIHPDQWCDEDFVELSLAARLLAIGLRNFCDDKGIFEWKPKKLKMKVFPADNVDCDALLQEACEFGIIMRFESGGKSYGAVKNFCKYQRPKKPNSLYPINEDALFFVGMSSEPEVDKEGGSSEMEPPTDTASSPPVPHQFPTSGENEIQMEDGIGKGKEEGKKEFCPFSEFWAIWPNKVSKQKAESAWKKLSHEERCRAIESTASWFAQWRINNPQASPIHAATYLNGKRWRDEATDTFKRGGMQYDRTDGSAASAAQRAGERWAARNLGSG